jgi:hypothetical protein
MSKASIKRHADFRKKAAKEILSAGGRIIKDDEYNLVIDLDTKRIGLVTFTMFKYDYDHRPKDELYSVYARTPLDITKDEMTAIATKVNNKYGGAPLHSMNPFSGKWNIHYSTANDALYVLSDRLCWLMEKG